MVLLRSTFRPMRGVSYNKAKNAFTASWGTGDTKGKRHFHIATHGNLGAYLRAGYTRKRNEDRHEAQDQTTGSGTICCHCRLAAAQTFPCTCGNQGSWIL